MNGAPAEGPLFWRPVLTLARREIQRFYRQRDRVTGAIAQPLMMWVLFGAGLSASFRPGGGDVGSMEYFLPGTVLMIVLFTAIFATISVIEDRNEGFLQGVLAAPVSRFGVVMGKVAGGTILAVPQGVVVLLLGPLVGIPLSFTSMLEATGLLTLISLALTALGLCIAWRMDSTQGFHAIMMVFLFPLWLLSGAFFPVAGAPRWLRLVMACNPLTYGLAALRRLLYGDDPGRVAELPGLALSLGVTSAFALVMIGVAAWMVSRPATGRSR